MAAGMMREERMNKVKWLLRLVLLIVYIFMWTVTWSGELAFWTAEFPSLRSRRQCRQDMVASMAVAAIPVLPWIVAPLMTGFYEDGFKFSCADEPLKNSFGDY
jgi:fatty acid desaturase